MHAPHKNCLKMKIGIITYWQSNDNYGQQLQCWALQQWLKDKGHQPYLIRYDFINRTLPVNKLKKVWKVMLVYPALRAIWRKSRQKSLENKIASLTIKNKARLFDKFREDRIEKSDAVYCSLGELQTNPPQADAYITGSDQVWSQLLDIKENEVFFLNFGNSGIRRISYAASFGMDEYPSKLNGALKDNLSRFDAVSVREKAGVDICKNVGIDSKMVLDPTLLLDSDNYRKIEASRRKAEYVYIYSLNVRTADEMYFTEVSAYAEQNNCKIVVTPASGCVLGNELFEGGGRIRLCNYSCMAFQYQPCKARCYNQFPWYSLLYTDAHSVCIHSPEGSVVQDEQSYCQPTDRVEACQSYSKQQRRFLRNCQSKYKLERRG